MKEVTKISITTAIAVMLAQFILVFCFAVFTHYAIEKLFDFQIAFWGVLAFGMAVSAFVTIIKRA